MNKMQRIFDNFMKDEGGIYLPIGENEHDATLSALLDVSIRFIEDIRAIHPNSPEVNIYLVDNEHEINACAFQVDSDYFISINTGAIIKLKQVFDTIFSSDKLFDDDLFIKTERHTYGPRFMYFSTMFLLVHEYSHIRFGHCDLVRYLYGTTLNELTSDSLIDDGIFRQTLEYDADCCTIANLTNRILMLSDGDINKVADDLGQWMLACYILFKVFDGGRNSSYDKYDLDSLAKSTHPRPGMRQKYLLGNIATKLLLHFKESDVDIIFDKIFDYIRKFEGVLSDVVDLKNIELGISFTEKGSEHLTRIANNWKVVRDMLEPYSHEELAPYRKVDFRSKILD